MPNTRMPFIYTQKHKHLGSAASSTATIPNNGVTKLTAAATYTLAGPEVGSLVTIYAVGADHGATERIGHDGRTHGAVVSPGPREVEKRADGGGTVTLLGEASTRWVIISAWPPTSSNAGVAVTT